jgi:Ca-activated chloride channel family protein
MLLRDSPYKGAVTYTSVINMAQNAVGQDKSGYREKFVEMVRKAETLK